MKRFYIIENQYKVKIICRFKEIETYEKVASFITVIILCLLFMACLGKTDNVVRNIGTSDKFSTEEINAAMNRVTDKFAFAFKGCEMTDLWYDEEMSDEAAACYLEYGKGSLNNVKAENVIVLFSNFNVGENGAELGFRPNSTCSDWCWILIRADKHYE